MHYVARGGGDQEKYDVSEWAESDSLSSLSATTCHLPVLVSLNRDHNGHMEAAFRVNKEKYVRIFHQQSLCSLLRFLKGPKNENVFLFQLTLTCLLCY